MITDYKAHFRSQGWFDRQQAAKAIGLVDAGTIEAVLDAAFIPSISIPYPHGNQRKHARMWWGPDVRRLAMARAHRELPLVQYKAKRISKRQAALQARLRQQDADIRTMIELGKREAK